MGLKKKRKNMEAQKKNIENGLHEENFLNKKNTRARQHVNETDTEPNRMMKTDASCTDTFISQSSIESNTSLSAENITYSNESCEIKPIFGLDTDLSEHVFSKSIKVKENELNGDGFCFNTKFVNKLNVEKSSNVESKTKKPDNLSKVKENEVKVSNICSTRSIKTGEFLSDSSFNQSINDLSHVNNNSKSFNAFQSTGKSSQSSSLEFNRSKLDSNLPNENAVTSPIFNEKENVKSSVNSHDHKINGFISSTPKKNATKAILTQSLAGKSSQKDNSIKVSIEINEDISKVLRKSFSNSSKYKNSVQSNGSITLSDAEASISSSFCSNRSDISKISEELDKPKEIDLNLKSIVIGFIFDLIKLNENNDDSLYTHILKIHGSELKERHFGAIKKHLHKMVKEKVKFAELLFDTDQLKECDFSVGFLLNNILEKTLIKFKDEKFKNNDVIDHMKLKRHVLEIMGQQVFNNKSKFCRKLNNLTENEQESKYFVKLFHTKLKSLNNRSKSLPPDINFWKNAKTINKSPLKITHSFHDPGSTIGLFEVKNESSDIFNSFSLSNEEKAKNVEPKRSINYVNGKSLLLNLKKTRQNGTAYSDSLFTPKRNLRSNSSYNKQENNENFNTELEGNSFSFNSSKLNDDLIEKLEINDQQKVKHNSRNNKKKVNENAFDQSEKKNIFPDTSFLNTDLFVENFDKNMEIVYKRSLRSNSSFNKQEINENFDTELEGKVDSNTSKLNEDLVEKLEKNELLKVECNSKNNKKEVNESSLDAPKKKYIISDTLALNNDLFVGTVDKNLEIVPKRSLRSNLSLNKQKIKENINSDLRGNAFSSNNPKLNVHLVEKLEKNKSQKLEPNSKNIEKEVNENSLDEPKKKNIISYTLALNNDFFVDTVDKDLDIKPRRNLRSNLSLNKQEIKENVDTELKGNTFSSNSSKLNDHLVEKLEKVESQKLEHNSKKNEKEVIQNSFDEQEKKNIFPDTLTLNHDLILETINKNLEIVPKTSLCSNSSFNKEEINTNVDTELKGNTCFPLNWKKKLEKNEPQKIKCTSTNIEKEENENSLNEPEEKHICSDTLILNNHIFVETVNKNLEIAPKRSLRSNSSFNKQEISENFNTELKGNIFSSISSTLNDDVAEKLENNEPQKIERNSTFKEKKVNKNSLDESKKKNISPDTSILNNNFIGGNIHKKLKILPKRNLRSNFSLNKQEINENVDTELKGIAFSSNSSKLSGDLVKKLEKDEPQKIECDSTINEKKVNENSLDEPRKKNISPDTLILNNNFIGGNIDKKSEITPKRNLRSNLSLNKQEIKENVDAELKGNAFSLNSSTLNNEIVEKLKNTEPQKNEHNSTFKEKKVNENSLNEPKKKNISPDTSILNTNCIGGNIDKKLEIIPKKNLCLNLSLNKQEINENFAFPLNSSKLNDDLVKKLEKDEMQKVKWNSKNNAKETKENSSEKSEKQNIFPHTLILNNDLLPKENIDKTLENISCYDSKNSLLLNDNSVKENIAVVKKKSKNRKKVTEKYDQKSKNICCPNSSKDNSALNDLIKDKIVENCKENFDCLSENICYIDSSKDNPIFNDFKEDNAAKKRKDEKKINRKYVKKRKLLPQEPKINSEIEIKIHRNYRTLLKYNDDQLLGFQVLSDNHIPLKRFIKTLVKRKQRIKNFRKPKNSKKSKGKTVKPKANLSSTELAKSSSENKRMRKVQEKALVVDNNIILHKTKISPLDSPNIFTNSDKTTMENLIFNQPHIKLDNDSFTKRVKKSKVKSTSSLANARSKNSVLSEDDFTFNETNIKNTHLKKARNSEQTPKKGRKRKRTVSPNISEINFGDLSWNKKEPDSFLKHKSNSEFVQSKTLSTLNNSRNFDETMDTSKVDNIKVLLNSENDSATTTNKNNLNGDIEYKIGDLVWAKIGNYPYWPAMITCDPNTRVFKKKKSVYFHNHHYHIKFFGDYGKRAWASKIFPYHNGDDLKNIRKQYQRGKLTKYIKECYIIKMYKQSAWLKAVAEADSIKNETLKKKLDFFEQTVVISQKTIRKEISNDKRKCDEDLKEPKAKKIKLNKRERSDDKAKIIRSIDEEKIAKESLDIVSDKILDIKLELEDSQARLFSNSNSLDHQIKRKSNVKTTSKSNEKNKNEASKNKEIIHKSVVIKEHNQSSDDEDFALSLCNISKSSIKNLNDTTIENNTEIETFKISKKNTKTIDIDKERIKKTPKTISHIKQNKVSKINTKNNEESPKLTDQSDKSISTKIKFSEQKNNLVLSETANEILNMIKINQTQISKNHIFKGVSKQRVCELCEKSDENIKKCKGPCNGIYHKSCLLDLATGLIKNGAENKDPPKIEPVQIVTVLSKRPLHQLTLSPRTDYLPLNEQIDKKMEEIMSQIQYNLDYASSGDESNTNAEETAIKKKVDYRKRKIIKHVTAEDDDCSSGSSTAISIKEPFKCLLCRDLIVPVCLICQNITNRSGSNFRQKCSIIRCGKFYHLDCLNVWRQTQWAFVLQGKSNTLDSFACPRHVCHTCSSDNFGSMGRCLSDSLVKCLRCPATYHNSSYCIPAGTDILSTTQVICPRHINFKAKQHRACNTTWCFLCSKGGNLICCETCPTSVHLECLPAINFNEDDQYICEDCESGRFPLYNDIVWVKLGTYRWWPAVILYMDDVPQNILKMQHERGEFVVRFFGSYDYRWVHRGRVFLFEEGDIDHELNGKKGDQSYDAALIEAAFAYNVIKESKLNRADEANYGLKPPTYIRIKINRPVGNVKMPEADLSNTCTPCDCKPNDTNPCGLDSSCINRILMTECSPDMCPAGQNCQNQLFEKRQYPNLEPHRTAGKGWGLRTLEFIRKDQFVIEYVGEMIDDVECQRRIRRMHQQKDENYYFLTIDNNRIIDAGPRGNLARFINHSCQPNCDTQKWTVNGDTRVGLFANQDIPAGSELTFNYNFECLGDQKKVCKCGASNCSGFIGAKPENQKITKKNEIRRKNKSPIPPSIETLPCFICNTAGDVFKCSNKACLKWYHQGCVGLESWPGESKWVCPCHNCNICTKRTVRSCIYCTNSFCPLHADGNISHCSDKGFICSEHNVKNPSKLSNQKEKSPKIKTKIKFKRKNKTPNLNHANLDATEV